MTILLFNSVIPASIYDLKTNHGRMIENIVAIKRSEKIYIQVVNSIDNPETFRRKIDPLLKNKDAYPKMFITRIRQEVYQYEGVKIIDVAHWLNG